MSMNRLIIYFLFLAGLCGIIQPINAQSLLQGEHIQQFTSTIHIQNDGHIRVEERIRYDFGQDERHGIIREIPLIKENSKDRKYRMNLDVESVTNEAGTNYTYEQSGSDTVELKIGDADTTISGAHTYIITYAVSGALTYFSDHDELYWNVIGTDWDVPIAESTSTIYVPEEILTESITSSCYTGVEGSTEQDCNTSVDSNRVLISSKNVLEPGQGMTAVVGFPTGIVSIVEPEEVKEFYTTIWGKILIGIGIFASLIWYLILPFWLPFKWWLSGRDPQSPTGPVQAWFDPPQTKSGRPLTPAETGTLIDEHASIREISALIISLAQRGYMKIVEKEKKEFEFIKIPNADEGKLVAFEKDFLKSIFAGKDVLSLKKAKLAEEVTTVQTKLYEDLVKEGFFPENPDTIRKRYAVLAGFAAFTFNFFLLISASVFGRIMPRKTLAGVHATHLAQSLKNFLSSQDRQLEFQAQNQMMFEKMLPFAIAFGVEKVWAERFKDIAMTSPDWYVGQNVGAFNSQTFTRGLGASMSSFKSAATPVSSSTGHSSGFSGGSSGGGGGGGGGGSW